MKRDPKRLAYEASKMFYESGHWPNYEDQGEIESDIQELMKEENWTKTEAMIYVDEVIRQFNDKDFLDEEPKPKRKSTYEPKLCNDCGEPVGSGSRDGICKVCRVCLRF